MDREERFRERQEAGELPPDIDVTEFALRLLVTAETVNTSRPRASTHPPPDP